MAKIQIPGGGPKPRPLPPGGGKGLPDKATSSPKPGVFAE